jgi:hypothetical protein
VFRAAQVPQADRWAASPSAGAAYATAAAESLAAKEVVYALRIPGRAEYLAALDAAVRSAVKQQATPQAALRQTADAWRAITTRLGVDAQRRASERSMVRLDD